MKQNQGIIIALAVIGLLTLMNTYKLFMGNSTGTTIAPATEAAYVDNNGANFPNTVPNQNQPGNPIQAAIEESKAPVALNGQKAENWVTLARIYRNILGVAQGADSWTVSSYQRAIVLDPQNPSYRIDLGGVLYGLKNYEEALKLFEQAVSIKPDLANAHYNLAWSSYQKQDYQRAAAEMQNVISLLDPKKQDADYKKAQQDLAEFKKMIPAAENQATQEAVQTPNELTIPTPAQEISPKIELPNTASPEAR